MRQPDLFLQRNSELSRKSSLLVFQDDSNDDNLDACLNKTSKNLGECILDCNNDSGCETDCVSAFKNEHSECPCQVFETDHNVFHFFFIGKLPTGMPMR